MREGIFEAADGGLRAGEKIWREHFYTCILMQSWVCIIEKKNASAVWASHANGFPRTWTPNQARPYSCCRVSDLGLNEHKLSSPNLLQFPARLGWEYTLYITVAEYIHRSAAPIKCIPATEHDCFFMLMFQQGIRRYIDDKVGTLTVNLPTWRLIDTQAYDNILNYLTEKGKEKHPCLAESHIQNGPLTLCTPSTAILFSTVPVAPSSATYLLVYHLPFTWPYSIASLSSPSSTRQHPPAQSLFVQLSTKERSTSTTAAHMSRPVPLMYRINSLFIWISARILSTHT